MEFVGKKPCRLTVHGDVVLAECQMYEWGQYATDGFSPVELLTRGHANCMEDIIGNLNHAIRKTHKTEDVFIAPYVKDTTDSAWEIAKVSVGNMHYAPDWYIRR